METDLIYIIKVSWLLLVFFTIYQLILTRMTFYRLNRIFLMGTLFLSFVLPFIPLPAGIRTVSLGMVQLPEVVVGLSKEVSGVTGVTGLSDLIFMGYLLVVFFLLWRLGSSLAGIFRLRRQSRRFDYQGITVYVSDSLIHPFSFGNWVFIGKSELSGERSEALLYHEFTHIRQYHTVDVLITELMCIFLWFHPLVWFYKKSIREVHEFLADESVLSHGFDMVQYLSFLMSSSCRASLYIVINPFNHSLLKRRFVMITKNKSGSRRAYLVSFILPVMLVFSFLSLGMLPTPSDSQSVPRKVLLSIQDNYNYPQDQDQDKVFEKVDNPPEYPGGFQALVQYIAANVKYPATAKKLGLQSTVYIQFVVDKNGSVVDAKILKVKGKELTKEQSKISQDEYDKCMQLMGEEGLRVVNGIPLKWKPGENQGKAVKVSMNLPIKFKLD